MISRRSQEQAYVRFFNVTKRMVNVLWINFSGVETRYAILQPSEFIDVNTFINHLWVFREHSTGTLYRGNCHPTYYPTTPTNNRSGRLIVRISYPLLRLSEFSTFALKNLLPMVLFHRPRLKVSYNSNDQVNLIFKNATENDVNIIWVAKNGQQLLYSVLESNQQTFVKTYHGHIWLAESTHGGQRLLIDGKQLFDATKSETNVSMISIKQPFYSLKELSQKQLRETIYCTKSVVELDLPLSLQRDLDRDIITKCNL